MKLVPFTVKSGDTVYTVFINPELVTTVGPGPRRTVRAAHGGLESLVPDSGVTTIYTVGSVGDWEVKGDLSAVVTKLQGKQS